MTVCPIFSDNPTWLVYFANGTEIRKGYVVAQHELARVEEELLELVQGVLQLLPSHIHLKNKLKKQLIN